MANSLLNKLTNNQVAQAEEQKRNDAIATAIEYGFTKEDGLYYAAAVRLAYKHPELMVSGFWWLQQNVGNQGFAHITHPDDLMALAKAGGLFR
jgi:hypothetical protein